MGEPLWKQCLAWLRDWSMVPPGVEVSSAEELALDLKAKSGVKHMKIYVEGVGSRQVSYSFSEARSFPTLPQLIGFYRTRDLLENFSYRELEGVKLTTPYKNV